MNTDMSVIIVGGGIVGASLARALMAHSALHVTLIDAQAAPLHPWPEGWDRRVVALNAASQQWLTQLDIWPRLTRPCPYTEMAVWDGQGTGSLHFSASELHRQTLGHIVENRCVLRALWQALGESEGVTLLPNSRVSALQLPSAQQPLGQVVLDTGQCLKAALILAADGAASPLRHLAGIATRQWDYGHTALVTTVKTERPHGHTAWQRFAAEGPLAFLPLAEPSGCYSSIVWSVHTDYAQQLLALPTGAFCQALTNTFEQRLGQVVWADERLGLPLQQCHAKTYTQPGFALLGDAAHAIHPLAGQGVNLGLADARLMAEEILQALNNGVPLHHPSLLSRYQRGRMSHNLAAMASMEALKRLFEPKSLALAAVRALGMRQLAVWPALKRPLMQLAQGL